LCHYEGHSYHDLSSKQQEFLHSALMQTTRLPPLPFPSQRIGRQEWAVYYQYLCLCTTYNLSLGPSTWSPDGTRHGIKAEKAAVLASRSF